MTLDEYHTLKPGYVVRAIKDLGEVCSKGDVKLVLQYNNHPAFNNIPVIYYEKRDGTMNKMTLALCYAHFDILFVL